jgi:hypothetical protein
MKRAMTIGVFGVLVLMAATVAAQPGIGLSTTPLPLERGPLEAPAPGPDRARPSIGSFTGGPSVSHDPVFVGPTLRSETTELGFSVWTAPNTPVGGPQAGWRDPGWAAVGLTFTWGGPSHRPPSRAAIR